MAVMDQRRPARKLTARQPARGGQPSQEFELPLRVTLLAPPPGVQFCLQGRPGELFDQKRSNGEDLSFDFSVRVSPGKTGGSLRFLGPFTQGPPAQRFVYICAGTSAGQAESCWTRRAKVPLAGITSELSTKARKAASARLEARIRGTATDGGPACATVPLLDGGWRLTLLPANPKA